MLNRVDDDATKDLVKFVHTSGLLANVNNVKSLHVAADYFNFEKAALFCEFFL